MSAYRLNGGRVFYVEHECTSARSSNPSKKHMLHGHMHNPVYVVRMYHLGDMDASQASVDMFAYMTDGITGSGGAEAYVDCPVCGAEGKIVTNRKDEVEIKEAFAGKAAAETPFR